ncbi:MAG: ATP-binding protein [Acidobacteria bacterium]|nr:ATP-binding protein [Acidobacteriota bacterium]MYK88163.1 ATP-binding protein [Acidobacteriota bacterium]
MIPRHLATTVERAAAQYPVVSVNGPRQSGKTTLLRSTFPDHHYVSLESPDERAFALEDPRGFLGRFDGPVILDEAQRAPDLFSYIQTIVDEDPAPGRFLLSGSRNFLLMQSISQSLAGRVRLTSLLPFSLSELTLRDVPSKDELLDGGARHPAPGGAWTEHALRGFYPRIHDRGLDPGEWLAQYFQTYLERDVRDLTQVGDLEAFGRFVRLCAGRAGGLLNLSSLGNDCGVSHDTARRWLSVLETSFVTFRLQPYHRSFNRRLTRRAKLYFVDSGLLCWLLRIRDAGQLASHAARGAVFENLMIAEALKVDCNAGETPDLYHWRDHRGNEIDLIVDTPAGPHAVEIKSGETVAGDFFKGLTRWRALAGRSIPATLVYGGGESYVRNGIDVRTWRDWL